MYCLLRLICVVCGFIILIRYGWRVVLLARTCGFDAWY